MATVLRLKVIEGKLAGEEVDVPVEGATIGRSDDADVILPPKLVSRLHCKVSCRDGTWVVQDLDSRNGTYVNEKTEQQAVISPGDRLRVGVNVIEVIGEENDGADPAPPPAPSEQGTKAEPGSAVEIVALCDAKVLDAISFTLREIIRKVPRGRAFDSHFLISELIRLNSDAYLRFSSEYAKSAHPTEMVHKQLSHVVASFAKLEEGLRVAEKPSWSLNPYGKAGECDLWVKL